VVTVQTCVGKPISSASPRFTWETWTRRPPATRNSEALARWAVERPRTARQSSITTQSTSGALATMPRARATSILTVLCAPLTFKSDDSPRLLMRRQQEL